MQPAYATFDAYVAEHPEAECHRRWLTADGNRGWAFVQIEAGEAANAFPGGYLRLAVFPLHERIPQAQIAAGDRTSRKDRPQRVCGWRVYLADSDDGESYKDFPVGDEGRARQMFDDIRTLAPFSLSDVRAVFFDWPTGRNKPKQRM